MLCRHRAPLASRFYATAVLGRPRNDEAEAAREITPHIAEEAAVCQCDSLLLLLREVLSQRLRVLRR